MFFKTTAILALGTISQLLSGVQAAKGWETLNSTAVDFDTFNSLLRPGTTPFIGPKGVYTITADEKIVYVDAMPGGDFAVDHPAEYGALISSLNGTVPLGIEFLPGGGGGGSGSESKKGKRALCGQVCSDPNGGVICETCRCQFYMRTCLGPWACADIWSCR